MISILDTNYYLPNENFLYTYKILHKSWIIVDIPVTFLMDPNVNINHLSLCEVLYLIDLL